jgi:hypothetical protein
VNSSISEVSVRALKVLVVGMGVLIVAATVTLVVLIVQRAGGAVPSLPATPAGELALRQPAGSRIGGVVAGAEGRVAIWVQRPDGDRVLLLDTRTGRTAAEIRLGE